MFVSVQNELPNYSLKSNKLDGSFFFYPRTNFFILASCTTLSVLCKSFQRTLSINLAAPRQLKQASLRSTCTSFPLKLSSSKLISFCLRFRSLDTNPRHDITEASFVLFIWLIGLLLESGCKGIAFLQTSKTFAGKSWVLARF